MSTSTPRAPHTPDFTPTTIPFHGDVTAWASACLWRGYGDLLLEETMQNTAKRYQEKGIRREVERDQVRKCLCAAFKKIGWSHDRLVQMGWK